MTTGLRLGVIGLSEGNGHPYSWSAIFNGYDRVKMAACPFPVIPGYLSKQTFPLDAIPEAKVTHVWTQQREHSVRLAEACHIPNVVDDYCQMIGHVDGILLARDDAENHLQFSLPFLAAGLPIYIDKPVTITLSDLRALYAEQRFPGQIFSCSALRFATEFKLDPSDLADLGPVAHVQATVPKTWQRYGVHALDAIFAMFDLYERENSVKSVRVGDVHVVTVDWGHISAVITCLGTTPAPIAVRVFGKSRTIERVFEHTYSAFKLTLEQFIQGLLSRSEVTTEGQLTSTVSILERGAIES